MVRAGGGRLSVAVSRRTDEEGQMAIPVIDPKVRYVTRGQLRQVPTELWTTETYVVTESGQPLAVLLPYPVFLEMQETIEDKAG